MKKLYFKIVLFTFISALPFTGNTQVTASDCVDAINACTNPNFIIQPSGSGNDQEFTTGSISNPSVNPASSNSGCLLAGELNSTWIIISCVTSGTLEFSMGDGSSPGCMDWIMWPYNANACNEISNNNWPPVRCNWNGACLGFTGIAGTVPAGASPFDFEPPLNVNAGDQFIVCFSNYSGQQNLVVPMDFFGTAQVSCYNTVFICPGGSTTLTGFAGLPGSTYSWTPVTGIVGSSTTQTITVQPGSSTVYECITTQPNATILDTMIQVTINTPPTLTVAIVTESCPGANDGSITVTPNGAAPFTFTIDGNPAPNGNFTGLGDGNYLIEVTDNNGCITDSLITIAAPAPCCPMTTSISMVQTSCPTTCDGTATAGFANNLGTVTFVWLDNLGNPIGQTTQTATGLCAGTYTVDITDPGLCTISETITITSGSGLTMTFTDSDPNCNGVCDGTITINAASAVLFSIDNGVTTQASNVFNGLCAGNYVLYAEDAGGCSATANTTLDNPALLTVNISSITNVNCNGNNTGAMSTTTTGGTLPYSYSWSNGQTTANANGLIAGNYTITVTDANGCTATDTDVIIQPTALAMTFATVDVTCFSYCDGSATVIPAGGVGPYQYNWNSTGNTAATQITTLCAGTHDLVITDANGCTIDSLNFVINQPAPIAISSVNAINESCYEVCDGSITINSPNGTFFSIDNGITLSPINNFQNLCDGIYQIVVEDNTGCSASTSAVLIAPSPVIADFTAGPQPTTISNPVITFVNLSQNNTFNSWDFGGLGTSNSTNPFFAFPNDIPGTYSVCLSISDANGCVDTVCKNVLINDDLLYYVPNAFTPDGDGINEIFLPILNNFDEENYQMMIFNRWGEIIFQTENILTGWDGSQTKGPVTEKVKNDVYIWKINGRNKDSNERVELIGHVSVIK